MWHFFQRFRGGPSRPLRKHGQFFVRTNKSGDVEAVPICGEEATLSADGSIDTCSFKTSETYPCGHSATREHAGTCLCGAECCPECFGYCGNRSCNRPLCRSCQRYFSIDDSHGLTLCPRCHDDTRRRARLQAVVRTLVSPFVVRKEKTQ